MNALPDVISKSLPGPFKLDHSLVCESKVNHRPVSNRHQKIGRKTRRSLPVDTAGASGKCRNSSFGLLRSSRPADFLAVFAGRTGLCRGGHRASAPCQFPHPGLASEDSHYEMRHAQISIQLFPMQAKTRRGNFHFGQHLWSCAFRILRYSGLWSTRRRLAKLT